MNVQKSLEKIEEGLREIGWITKPLDPNLGAPGFKIVARDGEKMFQFHCEYEMGGVITSTILTQVDDKLYSASTMVGM